jgi:hypothetical protein
MPAHHPLSNLGHDPARTALRALGGSQVDDCEHCLMWALRHRVALGTLYQISVYVQEPELRELILDDVVAIWTRRVDEEHEPGTFEDFFFEYCQRIIREVPPGLKASTAYHVECSRVWINHANRLSRRRRKDQSTGRAEAQTRSNESR